VIEGIIAALVSSSATAAGKDLYTAVASRLKAVFPVAPPPEVARRAIAKLEAGHADEADLRETLLLLTERQISAIKAEMDAARGGIAASSQQATFNISGTTISGGTFTGISNVIK